MPPTVLRNVRFFLDLPYTTGAALIPSLLQAFAGRLERDEGPKSPLTSELVRRHVYLQADPEGLTRELQARGTALYLGRTPYSRLSPVFSPEHVLVFLRDPVTRVVAHWEAEKAEAGFQGSLVEFARLPRNRNLQHRWLDGAPLRRLGFLGSSEQYESSFERLVALSSFASLSPELARDEPPRPAHEPTASERAIILESNARDVALYERAAFSRERPTLFARVLAKLLGAKRPKRESRAAKRERKRRMSQAAARHRGPYAEGILPLVSKEQRLAVLFTQKAGCTFAVKWFFAQVGLLEEATSYSDWIHDYREQVFYARQSYRPEDIALPDMRVLKFVRNPFSRAVSSYVHANRIGYEDRKLKRFLGRSVRRDRRYSFREFVHYLGSLDLRTCNLHHRLQVHPLEENGLVQPSHIVPIEVSHSLLSELERQLSLEPTNLVKLAASKHHTERSVDRSFCGDEPFLIPRGQITMPSTEAFYDPELERSVARLYREDFERYGYAQKLGG